MKDIFTKWMLIATILCSIGILPSCNKKNNDETAVTEVKSTELLRTSQSWNGEELPDYPQGRPSWWL